MFFKDGGVNSIAGMEIGDDKTSKNLVAIAAQWGASQLVLSFVIWAVILFHREMVPLMLSACELELILRYAVRYVTNKRIYSTHTPPGATGNKIMLPIVLVMCLWSYYR